ncbi:MAG: DUF2098 family protein [Methanosarcinaceae archaeon]|nr:DUF2098 family protein [Methanosarcinaceae archaeon]MDD4749314.1 DUF2098 family protein [Methanosarcinaceae archaeon]
MAEIEAITAIGRDKKPIKVGDTVKYLNSDTVSRVAAIEKKEEGTWVLLQATNLWYREESLELTDLKIKEKKEKKKMKVEDLKEKIEKQKEAVDFDAYGAISGVGAG